MSIARATSSVAGSKTDKKGNAALETFETLFFNNMTLALDCYFVTASAPSPVRMAIHSATPSGPR